MGRPLGLFPWWVCGRSLLSGRATGLEDLNVEDVHLKVHFLTGYVKTFSGMPKGILEEI